MYAFTTLSACFFVLFAMTMVFRDLDGSVPFIVCSCLCAYGSYMLIIDPEI
jgi:hypothetical protein